MSCRKSTVKRATAGVWTVHCTATYSDDEKVTGIASVLLAKEQVTWEPTGTVSGG
jgi:ribosomal protein L37AE/L43A